MPTKRKSNKTTQNSNTFVSQDRFHINITTKSSTHGLQDDSWTKMHIAYCLLAPIIANCLDPRRQRRPRAVRAAPAPHRRRWPMAVRATPGPTEAAVRKNKQLHHTLHIHLHIWLLGAPSQHSMTQHKTEDEIYIYICIHIHVCIFVCVLNLYLYQTFRWHAHTCDIYGIIYPSNKGSSAPCLYPCIHDYVHIYTHIYIYTYMYIHIKNIHIYV